MHLMWRRDAKVEDRPSAIVGIVISSSLIVLLLALVLLVQEVESCGGGGGGGKGGGMGGGFKKGKFGGGFKKEKFGKKFGKKMKAVKSVGSMRGGYYDDDSYEPRVSRLPQRQHHYADDYVELVQRPRRAKTQELKYVVVPVGGRYQYEPYEPPVQYVQAPQIGPSAYEEDPVVRYERAGPRESHRERPSLRKELGKALLRAVAS